MSTALVSCVVGNVEYALRAADIVAVMRAERMRTPAACEGGIGVVTVGGERASVHSLGATVGTSPAPDDRSAGRDRHIVVLRGAAGLVGWLVDRVSRSRLPEGTRVLPLPALVGARALRWFAGVLSTGERTMLLLSLSPPGPQETATGTAADRAPLPGTDRSMPPETGAPLVVAFGSDALPSCGAARYAVSARRVAGVESGLHVARVPGSELPVIGVSVWRGEVLPVLDFRQSGADPERIDRRVLIVRCGGSLAGTSVAIPVDTETALCQPSRDNLLVDRTRTAARPVPPFVVGLFDVRGQKVALIDPDVLMPIVPRTGSDTSVAPAAAGADCSAAGRASTPWTSIDWRTRV